MSALKTTLTTLPTQIALQFSSRLLTFALNQLLLRHLSPSTLGLSAQLELYSTTVLFFSRESIRVACQRPVGEDGSSQAGVNLAWVASLLGAPIAWTLGSIYLRSSESADTAGFSLAVIIYGLSAVVELLAEPAYVAAQQALAFRVRARAETAGTLGRCIGTALTAFWMARKGGEGGVLAFAVGQGVYSVVVVGCYTVMVRGMEDGGKYALMPKRIVS
jgi:oligosaccharide translocation protein RFT1